MYSTSFSWANYQCYYCHSYLLLGLGDTFWRIHIANRFDAGESSHVICDYCLAKLFPNVAKKIIAYDPAEHLLVADE